MASPIADSAAAMERFLVGRDPPWPWRKQALYACACGYVFKAAVTTSVGCPHCGSAQAW